MDYLFFFLKNMYYFLYCVWGGTLFEREMKKKKFIKEIYKFIFIILLFIYLF